ncbi:MAG: esterase-like activity of phytase family protein [Phycisphaerales bacterium]
MPKLTAIRAAVAVVFTASGAARADVQYLGAGVVAGTVRDRSGLKEELAPGLPHDYVGSFGSGLAYSGSGELYLGVSDRGPRDGALDFRDRFHVLRIVVTPGSSQPVAVTIERTSLLSDEGGRAYVGSIAAIDRKDDGRSMRLDPEAIAASPAGTVWTADEYGPWLDEWTPEGRHLRRIEPPAKFRVEYPAKSVTQEMRPHNLAGRQANRGFEGMCLSPDGARIYAILQSPLIQDGGVDEDNKRIGTNIRMLEVTLGAGGAASTTREFVYRLDNDSYGVNELTPVGEGSFLVIEKDGKPAEEAKVRRVYRVEIGDATDVSAIAKLPSRGLPPGVTAVRKALLLDMMEPRFKLAGATMPEKVEGLAIGPDLPDGRRLLLIASDNDYNPGMPTYVWAFAVDAADLPGFKRAAASCVWSGGAVGAGTPKR